MQKTDSLTIKLIDEEKNQIGLTYPKRAAGLVKKNRAYYVDENTICLGSKPKEEKVENDKKVKPKGLAKIQIPKYSLSEELMSAISHGVGAILSLVILITCLIVSIKHHNGYGIIGSIIYGLNSILLYIVSTLYHALKPNRAKKVFRIIDHCTIYLLIAGTYTPYALVTLREVSPLVGWSVFIVVWLCAIIGIVFTAINMNKFKVPGLVLYLVMGWVIIFNIKTLIDGIETAGFIYMIVAGIIYTIGAILYGLGKKIKYMHSIFHFFVVIASFLFYLSIIKYVL